MYTVLYTLYSTGTDFFIYFVILYVIYYVGAGIDTRFVPGIILRSLHILYIHTYIDYIYHISYGYKCEFECEYEAVRM